MRPVVAHRHPWRGPNGLGAERNRSSVRSNAGAAREPSEFTTHFRSDEGRADLSFVGGRDRARVGEQSGYRTGAQSSANRSNRYSALEGRRFAARIQPAGQRAPAGNRRSERSAAYGSDGEHHPGGRREYELLRRRAHYSATEQ